MTVVHTKGNLIEVSIAIVLRNRRPCVTEGIYTVVVFFPHPHIFAYLLNTIVHIGTETIRIAIAAVEVEQIWIILNGEVLVKDRLDKRLYSHFDIRLV